MTLDGIRDEIASLPEKVERRAVAKVIRVLVWLFDQLAPKIRAAMVEAAERYEKPKAKDSNDDV